MKTFDKPKERNCLKCGKKFNSLGVGNRLCGACCSDNIKHRPPASQSSGYSGRVNRSSSRREV